MVCVHWMRGHSPPDKSFCGDCSVPKNEPSRWLAVLPRGDNKGKGKGKGGKGKNESKNKGKGKDPAYRKAELGDWLQVARRGAAVGQQPAGKGPSRAGAAQTDKEKSQAAEIAALQRQLAAKTAAGPTVASEDVPVEREAEADRRCSYCDTSHRNIKATACRICATSMTATGTPEAALGQSPAEVAAARAELTASRASLATLAGSLSPAVMAAAVKDIEGKLLRLDTPSKPLSVYMVLAKAQREEEEAQTFLNKLIDKEVELDARKSALDIDLEAVARAMTYANQGLNQKRAALAAATAALPTAAPATNTGGAPQQGPAVLLQSIMELIALTIAENTGGHEEFLQKLGPRVMAMAGGAVAEPPVVPLRTAQAQPEAFFGAPGAPDGTARPTAGGAGRLQPRVSLKTAAVEETPAAAVRKQQEAARQRKEVRDAELAARREGSDGEAEDDANSPAS